MASVVSSSSAASNANTKKAMDQYNADARLMADFEQSGVSGKSFHYSKSVSNALRASSTGEQMAAYLSRMQRGGLVQSFGCLLAIEEPNFIIIAYSENCFDMLGLRDLVEPMGLIGMDARTFFTPSSRASLEQAIKAREISFSNPIGVHSRTNHRSFYAILHRIDVGTVIDLEPAHTGDPITLHAGAVQYQKLAVRAISKLQSLPGGDIGVLCDTVVEDVQKLTGYDRVMVYKFHEDYHGEVVSEIRRSDLEPYLGLHYPATDIPQAARFLFKQNRVRMICNCNEQPVKIIQKEELKQPLCLVNSTLRSPHDCHKLYMANMGSIASMVMAVVINNGDSSKLWGLVACHHCSPRYHSFPLRYACEFLMQAFGLQIYMELQMESLLAEKKVLQVQTLLCDKHLRDSPFGLVTQSPNIMNLVRCDGAALYYGGKCSLLGLTPTEAQVKDIVEWLLRSHGDSSGFSTDCMADAGYPGAALLGNKVCGLAAARITPSDFLFWFRFQAEMEIKWAGAKHHPNFKDDGSKMDPRSSFNAFVEVVKNRSLPWKDVEINAIHSLQLIVRDSLQEIEKKRHKDKDDDDDDSKLEKSANDSKLDNLTCAAFGMVRLIETANAPIFGVDLSGHVNGWNSKMCDLTGLDVSTALGKSLIHDIVHEDSSEVVEAILARALQGEEDPNVEVKLLKFGKYKPSSVVHLLVNACTSRDYKDDITGVCFIGQDVTAEKTAMDKFAKLQGDYKAVIESQNPLMPPIFASDETARCCEWNAAMEKMTGWDRHEVIGKLLPGDIFGNLCRLKGRDTLTEFMVLLYRALGGHDIQKLAFGFYDRRGKFVEAYLTANKRVGKGGNIIGCLCFLQMVVTNQEQSIAEKTDVTGQLKELTYIKQETQNPLSGIQFTRKLLEGSSISNDQKQLLETSNACEKQILSIMNSAKFGSLEERQVEIKAEEFILGNVLNAVISQSSILIREKNLQLIHDIPEEIKALSLYGDEMKLQLSLSDFFCSVVDYAPSPDSWVEIKASEGIRLMRDEQEFVQLQFRVAHPGQGLPSAIIEDMFSVKNQWVTHEGIALYFSQKLISLMNGNVSYIRDRSKCYFQVDLQLKLKK
ncbi:phytochrome E-like [Andrographis paniculata]|uniref:phytochrome E-like n=1 Tax=Andrographis paniculata TaxID=175694 RepID=UPI0021E80FE0|nr:phytochrome E-like [Andrographis paniculata]XP_051129098.1 phytochrome E-like [Andrographis paniculata]